MYIKYTYALTNEMGYRGDAMNCASTRLSDILL